MSNMQQKKATWRMGARERFRLQWFAVALICMLLAVGLRPMYDSMVNRRLGLTCQDNVKKLAQGLNNYMNDWDDTTPLADTWLENVSGNMGVTSGTGFGLARYYHCPTDKTSSPCSYAYNDFLSGLSQTVKPSNDADAIKATSRLSAIGRFDRAPLVFEKHGSQMNAHLTLRNWDDVERDMTTPHDLPEPSGTVIFGNRNPGLRSREQLQTLNGRKF